MKNNFIIEFLREFLVATQELADTLSSRSYKGVGFKRYKDPIFRQGLNNLHHRGFLKTNRPGRYEITQKGNLWLRKSLLRYHHAVKTKWDHRWRVVIFDVPKELDRARNNFRRKLKTLGFSMLQRSVFVFPYKCEDELSAICSTLKIGEYVAVIIADSLGSFETNIRKLYNL